MNCEEGMIKDALEVLECDLRGATKELFDAYGIAVDYADGGPSLLERDGSTVVSVIGFASEQMRGALAMVSTRETIVQWQPGLDESEPGVIDDTIAEFSNMLLGRLKAKLIQRGITLLVATPTTASGANMTLRPPAGLSSRWHRFESPSGGFCVRLDVTFEPNSSFRRMRSEFAPAAAGDMMLF